MEAYSPEYYKALVEAQTRLKRNKMFFITVFSIKAWDVKDDAHFDKRCWGFFSEEATARKAVMENWTDMYEDASYNLAVIEEINEGLPAHSVKETWFLVDPIWNVEAITRRIARDKAWRESVFFGKKLGEYMLQYINLKFNITDPDLVLMGETLREFADKIDMPWQDLDAILNGDASPEFKDFQWPKLIDALKTLVDIDENEYDELEQLRLQALLDKERHGKPKTLDDPPANNAWALGGENKPMTRGSDWMVLGYNVQEIQKPKRFEGVVGWSLG